MTPAPPAVDVQDAFCLHPLADGGAVAALRGLSLRVCPGERLVVHGPNGSGKTTLLRTLAGEQRLAAGRAVVAGLEVAGASSRELARWRSTQLGQIDQDAWRLLRPEFDVLANVSLQLRIAGVARQQARARGLAALDRLGLADLATRHPGTLSGGQRQRVAVCAAVAHGPTLVLADEPTGELDLASADAVYALLAAAVADAGATLVLVTHDHRAGMIADRVVRIRDGRISETWRPRAVPVGVDGEHEPAEKVPESLVVDARGWVRLPADLRAGLGSEVSVRNVNGELLLRREDAGSADPVDAPVGSANPVSAGSVSPGSVSAGSVRPDLRSNPVPDPGAATPGPIAALSGVVVQYGERAVFGTDAEGQPRGLDLDVWPGELTVLAGRSGAGKSTLLRVLLGLQRPDLGRVLLTGVDLDGLDRSARAALRARCCAVVLQQIHLVATADAAANLDLARAARGLPPDPVAGERLLAQLGLTGLAAVGGRPVAGLSGGERQRLAVARAIAVQPLLLVLDEPTSQLDEASAQLLAAALLELRLSGTAVVVASHDPVLVTMADRVHELT